jgi:hypothetical protein
MLITQFLMLGTLKLSAELYRAIHYDGAPSSPRFARFHGTRISNSTRTNAARNPANAFLSHAIEISCARIADRTDIFSPFETEYGPTIESQIGVVTKLTSPQNSRAPPFSEHHRLSIETSCIFERTQPTFIPYRPHVATPRFCIVRIEALEHSMASQNSFCPI